MRQHTHQNRLLSRGGTKVAESGGAPRVDASDDTRLVEKRGLGGHIGLLLASDGGGGCLSDGRFNKPCVCTPRRFSSATTLR